MPLAPGRRIVPKPQRLAEQLAEAIDTNNAFLVREVQHLGLTSSQIGALEQVREVTRQQNVVMRAVLDLLDRPG